MDYFAAVRTFVRAAELGSLTRTAQALDIKTSTASRHLADLEADLRIALFNRSTRGLSLTEGGKVFYARASEILAQLEEAREATSALNATPSGVLRVTMSNAFGQRHIMPYLGEFMERYPQIDIDAILTDDTLNLIESHIDLGIRIGTLADSTLMARCLAPQRRVACATPTYLQRYGVPDTPAAIENHFCLLHSRFSAHFWYVKSNGAVDVDWQKYPIHGRLTVNDSEAQLGAVLDHLGIALLPDWLAGDDLTSGDLTRILSAWDIRLSRDDVSIWAVYPRKKTVSSKVRAFIDFFAEKFGDQPYWTQAHGLREA